MLALLQTKPAVFEQPFRTTQTTLGNIRSILHTRALTALLHLPLLMAVLSLPLSFTNSFWSQDYRRGLDVLFNKLDQVTLFFSTFIFH